MSHWQPLFAPVTNPVRATDEDPADDGDDEDETTSGLFWDEGGWDDDEDDEEEDDEEDHVVVGNPVAGEPRPPVTSSGRDPEIATMEAIYKMIKELSPESRDRVAEYINSRLDAED
jgi:hypothetical protein